ncbi:MAG: CNNM domain-containing protein, partial [Dehalococcoidales bacterium]|nr:CNNM domain-containing protein [Dehalococcoidales bacterium]
MEIPYVTLLILFILLSAFFSSSETAYISLSHVRLNHLLANKVPGAKRVAKMVEHPERLLSAILVGNNLVNTAATAIATVLAISFWGEEHGVVIATIGITVILLIFGEVTPKSFAARYSEKVAIAYAGPVRFITILFSPVVYLLSSLVLGLMKLMGGGSVYRRSLFNEDEIRSLIDRGHIEGSVEKDQAEMLHRV